MEMTQGQMDDLSILPSISSKWLCLSIFPDTSRLRPSQGVSVLSVPTGSPYTCSIQPLLRLGQGLSLAKMI